MKKQSLALTTGVLAALAGLAPTVASATGTCYAFVPANYAQASIDGGPPLRMRPENPQEGEHERAEVHGRLSQQHREVELRSRKRRSRRNRFEKAIIERFEHLGSGWRP